MKPKFLSYGLQREIICASAKSYLRDEWKFPSIITDFDTF